MRRTRFDDNHCPIARTTDLLGDWWTPIVLRQLFFGQRRFDEIADATEISRAVLTARLKRLTEEGLVTRQQYQDRPARYEYVLTDKGIALWEVVAAMWRFGDDWLFDQHPGAAVKLVDTDTGEEIRPRTIDENTGRPLDLLRTRVKLRRRPNHTNG